MPRPTVAVAILALLSAVMAHAQPREQLVERTLAIVGGRAVTLADVRTAMALALVADTVDIDAATESLVERVLVLREVERYAPPEPSEQTVTERLEELAARVSEAEVAEVLTAGGFSEARLRAWIRDDLRIAAYLEQRFALTADLSVEQAAPEVRARLSAQRRASLIADWVTDLRRRTPVVELWKQR